MTEILQTTIPYDPLTPKALPGIAPLDPRDWILIDDAYAKQMAYRRHLIARKASLVTQTSEIAMPEAREILAHTLEILSARADFQVTNSQVICPDGHVVDLDHDAPLATLGQITQEDICLLQKQGNEHVLTGAVLCFPASWTLSEKINRPLIGIHVPVPAYDADIAKRVQRLFDGVRVGRPLWRKNALWYDDPELFTPRPEAAPREPVLPTTGAYLRSERQAIMRLPESNAVVFSIHTFLLRRNDALRQSEHV